MKPQPPHTAHQQGMALIEALIASAILGIGLVGATQLTLKTLNTATLNRQHTVAQHLAQEAMDCLRAQAHLWGHANAPSCPNEESLLVHGVTYTRQARSTPGGSADVTDLHVRVTWPASGPSGKPSTADGSPDASRLVEWHSSVSALPSWLGVSSP